MFICLFTVTLVVGKLTDTF